MRTISTGGQESREDRNWKRGKILEGMEKKKKKRKKEERISTNKELSENYIFICVNLNSFDSKKKYCDKTH